MKHLQSRLLPLGCLSLLCLTSLAQAQDYDAAKYFNATTNGASTNPFKYGSEATLGGAFELYTTYSANGIAPFASPIESYNTPGLVSGVPAVLYNNSNAPYFLHTGGTDINIGAHQLALHPGYSGQYSVVRFKVQTTGVYNVSGLFGGADTEPTTTDVHILLDSNTQITHLFDGGVNSNGYGNIANYTLSNLQLVSGDTLDFAVGYGDNHDYTYDTTVLNAHIAAVPELSTFLGFGGFVAFGGLAAVRQRKRSRQAA